ncbi:hypothetical protein [Niallia sp. 03133]|uniref:hypothetical protein n=1 Tax=Niallia sp. 03133 TaxID=3458060 RepID=UPI0040446DAB
MKTEVNRSIVSTLLIFLFFASLLFYLNIFLVQEITTIKGTDSLYEFHTIQKEAGINQKG